MPKYPSEQFRPGQPTPTGRPQRPAPSSLKGHPDIRSTKEYKLAARRWTSTIVALPIVLVTSYMIYERVYGDKVQKKFARPENKDN
ncbi:uncharacterized protein N7483_005858 [Penicillium malachiteum]|uniref:uncharacterized protein n=1 Tax=Penicillium malachiteum TaxID=1324776 RepID=UPI002548AEF0|nr:uncharacterized protein N7483_005858 [Penicillium malachiteum]KAJ5731350.1 hypothetical protein N7483_005858 [Penicillium malachiteum]